VSAKAGICIELSNEEEEEAMHGGCFEVVTDGATHPDTTGLGSW